MTTTTYTWDIAQLQRFADNGIIFQAHWTCSAQSDDGYSRATYGSVGLAAPEPDTLIPYADVTKVTVLQWLEQAIDMPTIELALDTEIEELRNPTTVTGFPWAETPAAPVASAEPQLPQSLDNAVAPSDGEAVPDEPTSAVLS